MRPLKFRAWFPKAKRMIHFEGISFSNEYDRLCFSIRESDCTEEYQHLAGGSYIPNEEGLTLEYTGLKDNTKWEALTETKKKEWLDRGETVETWNGVEIYEGDRVSLSGLNGTIIWDESSAKFALKSDGRQLVRHQTISKMTKAQMKIIGNIYEEGE